MPKNNNLKVVEKEDIYTVSIYLSKNYILTTNKKMVIIQLRMLCIPISNETN